MRTFWFWRTFFCPFGVIWFGHFGKNGQKMSFCPKNVLKMSAKFWSKMSNILYILSNIFDILGFFGQFFDFGGQKDKIFYIYCDKKN